MIDEKQYFVYILASGIGRKVVYYEVHTDVAMAILREKRIKRWSRRDKATMIERENPNWVDLFPRLQH